MDILKKGSSGESVKTLQKALTNAGYGTAIDGKFGSITEECVKAFQKANGLVADGIVGAKTWAKLGVKDDGTLATSFKKSKRKITEIIVHCTATPEGKDYTVADITRWHKDRGFTTIGYHYVVYRDGSIHNGRDVNISGGHCTGHNYCSIGVCYVGGCKPNSKEAKDTRTDAQKKALVELLKKLKAMYPGVKIYGHNRFAAKACPSFDATTEYKNL